MSQARVLLVPRVTPDALLVLQGRIQALIGGIANHAKHASLTTTGLERVLQTVQITPVLLALQALTHKGHLHTWDVIIAMNIQEVP